MNIRSVSRVVIITFLSVFVAGVTHAATFTVNRVLDGSDINPGDGVCATNIAANCTLRAAIEEANALPGTDIINFAITAGPIVKTLTPAGGYPVITGVVTIDGWTQGGPGYMGPPLIEIDGSNIQFFNSGLIVHAGNSTIRGLAINRFPQYGIILAVLDSNSVVGCYIGTDATGSVDLGNGFSGIFVLSSDNFIDNNVISGNDLTGVFLTGNDNALFDNLIGTDVTGTVDLGNTDSGIGIIGSNNVIGGISATFPNTIAFNNGSGINVDSGTGNQIRGNSIFSNDGLGIDLNYDGVTPNDLNDADTGDNNLQNFPEIGNASNSGGVTTIQYTLNSTPSTTFNADFYASPTCDSSGNGEGQVYIGSVPVTTGATGNTGGTFFPSNLIPLGRFITATATRSLAPRDSSEFSECVQVVNGNLTLVTNTLDSGAGSLRQAILDTNAAPGLDKITFNIPGAGVHTIIPLSALPTITDPVLIDGASQPGFAGLPLIQLDGTNAGANVDGLVIDTNASTIRSLIINRFNGEGIILSSGLGNGGNIVRNCFIGTDSSGTVDLGNNGMGVYILSPDNRIGGGNAATRNLISGNGSYGVQMFGASATGNTINGNYIGTTVSGTVALGNTLAGIIVQFGAVNNTIGGSTAGEGNLISGNGNTGILLAGDVLGSGTNTVIGNLIGTTANGNAALGNASGGVTIIGSINNRIGGTTVGERNVISGNLGGGGNGGVNIGGSLSSGNIISGNYIGTNIGGNAGVGNALYGVRVDDASNNRIGGTLPGEGNTIAFNGSNGVLIFQIGGTAVQNSIRANSIFSNVGIGIDLSPNSGVTANDLGDPDTGANNLQNYPVITGALTGSTRVIGTFNSTPSRQFRLEFFNSPTADASGNGEGQFFVGSFNVTTNGGGNVAFDQTFAYISAPNTFVAATATDLTTGDTSEFSVAKEILSPSAASVTVSGRVVTADGRGLGKVKVSITGPDSFRREALTNAFGFYGFPDIPVGESYVLNADHKRYQFSSRLITVLDEISELDFIALESQHFPSSGERSKLIGIQSK